jgi:hypothetical protein
MGVHVVTDFKVVHRGREPERCCYNCAKADGQARSASGFAVPGTRRCSIDGSAKDIEWVCESHQRR